MNSSEFLRLYEKHLLRHEAEMWDAILKSERKGFWAFIKQMFSRA